MSRPFIRGQVAIDSMRDNGFLSAAHALAELIDNSIQAGADRVELICFESFKSPSSDSGRKARRINKIGVLDNGCGMSPDVLHSALEFGASENKKNPSGIGKFGMGLPNSSISQCKHVDVWSWRSPDEVYYTYLDIEEIKSGELENIPEPVTKDIDEDVLKVCGELLPPSGTLVVWSDIDRCQWKTASSIYKHTQDVVGRMYRNFINDDEVSIWFKSAEKKGLVFVVEKEEKFLANDPLYLMKNTSLPDLIGDYKGEAIFELFDNAVQEFQISNEKGKRCDVKITGSLLKKNILGMMKSTVTGKGRVGATKWGKHAVKNMGLSVVRSGRELALLPEFVRQSAKDKGWGRWYGIQLDFDPDLDGIFGVTNNKQHVVNLRMMKASEDYEREGFESEAMYLSDLVDNNDPKTRIYEVVRRILEVEDELIARVKCFNFDGAASEGREEGGPVDKLADTLEELNKKREEIFPTDPPSITREELEEDFEKSGIEKIKEKVNAILDNELQVWVEVVPMATNAFFDVTTKKGFTLLQINSNHVFYNKILEKVDQDQREAIEICLAGWARMERECTSDKRLQQLQLARRDWGQLLEDYLEF